MYLTDLNDLIPLLISNVQRNNTLLKMNNREGSSSSSTTTTSGTSTSGGADISIDSTSKISTLSQLQAVEYNW